MSPAFTREPGASHHRRCRLCCCVCATSFQCQLTPLFVGSVQTLQAAFHFRLDTQPVTACCVDTNHAWSHLLFRGMAEDGHGVVVGWGGCPTKKNVCQNITEWSSVLYQRSLPTQIQRQQSESQHHRVKQWSLPVVYIDQKTKEQSK